MKFLSFDLKDLITCILKINSVSKIVSINHFQEFVYRYIPVSYTCTVLVIQIPRKKDKNNSKINDMQMKMCIFIAWINYMY